MKNIIIAEKPSVAQSYAKALGVVGTDKTDGYIENGKWVVTWTVGHLVSLSYPEKYDEGLKEWKLETLPFIPDTFKYEVLSATRKQFNVVRQLYNRSDIAAIYYAGDSGREGLYIQMLVRMLAGHNPKAKELVVWIDSQTDDEINRGVYEAKDISEYKSMSDAGYMRAIEDYLVGINFSRLMSLIYSPMVNSAAGHKKQVPISVGRVMSCVLGMVVNREREIRNFKVKNFYGIAGKINADGVDVDCHWTVSAGSRYYNSPKLYNNNGFNKISDANELMEALDKTVYISEFDRHIEKKNAPLLFNLAELQNECSKRFHMSSKETLEVAQNLYEKKLTTYPRTDARVLSTAISLEIGKNIKGLKNGLYAEYAAKVEQNYCNLNKRYIDDSKITDHYAIIPTGRQPDKALSVKEKQVYDIIVRRFLSIFYPATEFDVVKFTGVCSGEHFTGFQKVIVKKGYLEIYSNNDTDSDDYMCDVLPLKKDTAYEISFKVKAGATQAPRRYTGGSIILAMENAGNLIEDEQLREQIKGAGVGTSATRADIIEKLVSLDYIAVNKMKQTITPTNFGEMIYEVLSVELPEMLSPKITAQWEQKLDSISTGVLSSDTFKNEFYTYVKDKCIEVKEHYKEHLSLVKSKIKPYAIAPIRTEIKAFESWNTKLICPLCGGELETTAWGFKCKNNVSKDEGCSFGINGDILNHRLLTSELALLLKDGKCGPFYDFVSPKGKPFGAYLIWNKNVNKIEFEFVSMPFTDTDFKCPVCGGKIVKQDKIYKCEKYVDRDNGCKFFISKIAGKSLNDKQIEALTTSGSTDLITGFKNKEGNSFDAFLVLDAEKNIGFKFPTADDLRTDMKCPICGGVVVASRYGFMCENYKKKDVRKYGDCGFTVGTVYEHVIKQSELKKILSGEETNFINFKKDGKEFSARLYWQAAEKRIGFKFNDSLDVKCPLCGENLIRSKFGYSCSAHSKGCQFHVGVILGVLVDEEQLKKLVSAGKTDLISGFKPKDKNKNSFSAYLTWNKDDGVAFDFGTGEERSVACQTDYMCPACRSNKLSEGNSTYYCSCGFHMSKNISSVDIPKKQIDKLFKYGRTDVISGFFSPKKRKMFAARLVYDQINKKVSFSFLDTKSVEVSETEVEDVNK